MLTVVITTYQPRESKRGEYFTKVVDSLLDCLTPFDHLHIADDGSHDYTIINQAIQKVNSSKRIVCSVTNARRGGIGASLNLALRELDGDVWMYITDDWLLTEPLDLTVPLKLINELNYDLVRVGAIHPSLTMKTRFRQDLGWWTEILQTKGGYAFATRPFIATRDFYNMVGPFVEHKDAYITEQDYAVRVSRMDNIRLAHWGSLAGVFMHIGEECVGLQYP